jgi:hypothetical protein
MLVDLITRKCAITCPEESAPCDWSNFERSGDNGFTGEGISVALNSERVFLVNVPLKG